LSGYHINRIPAPLTGGLPGIAGREFEPVNNTLLSFTCNRAAGAVVPMPTFWDKQCSRIKMDIVVRKVFLIAKNYLAKM
jgi:hypothetical protein